MATVKYKNIKGVERLIIKEFTDFKNSDRNLYDIGQFAVERVRQQVRLGRSMVTGKRLKPLSEKYKEFRRRSGIDKDSEFFEPERSNLTLTGQLIRSLRQKIDRTKGLVEVLVGGTRRDGLTNKKVAEFVAQAGRPFLGLDDKAIAQVRKITLNNLRKLLRQKF